MKLYSTYPRRKSPNCLSSSLRSNYVSEIVNQAILISHMITMYLINSGQRRRNFEEQRNSFQDETNDVTPKEFVKSNELFLQRKRLNDLFPREQETETMATTAPTTPVTMNPATTEPEVSPEEAQQLFGISTYIFMSQLLQNQVRVRARILYLIKEC